jgi:hypothetical protein
LAVSGSNAGRPARTEATPHQLLEMRDGYEGLALLVGMGLGALAHKSANKRGYARKSRLGFGGPGGERDLADRRFYERTATGLKIAEEILSHQVAAARHRPRPAPAADLAIFAAAAAALELRLTESTEHRRVAPNRRERRRAD